MGRCFFFNDQIVAFFINMIILACNQRNTYCYYLISTTNSINFALILNITLIVRVGKAIFTSIRLLMENHFVEH